MPARGQKSHAGDTQMQERTQHNCSACRGAGEQSVINHPNAGRRAGGTRRHPRYLGHKGEGFRWSDKGGNARRREQHVSY